MVETLHPGVFIDEQQMLAGPIQGVTTATAVMCGVTSKGPLREAILVNSWTEFTLKCGGFRSDSYLAYSAYNYFQNGGKRLWVLRLCKATDDPAVATVTLVDRHSVPAVTLKIDAKNGGAWGNSLRISITNGTLDEDNQFKIIVKLGTEIVEVWDNLSMVDADANYVEGIINNSSDYITVTDLDSATTSPNDRPAIQTDTEATLGDDGTAPEAGDFIFTPLNNIEGSFMLACPGVFSASGAFTSLATVIGAGTAYAEGRGNSTFVADPTVNLTVAAMVTFRKSTINVNSSYGTLYYPWVLMSDPSGVGTNPVKYVPPSGFVMGVTARTDLSRGAWKAPAGVDANCVGALGLQAKILDSDQDQLNPIGVNCIRIFSGIGIVVYGARTLSNNIQYVQIPVRRNINYIKESFKNGFVFAPFEINDETLWATLIVLGRGFLIDHWKKRGLYGPTADKAFFIKCDAEINTQAVIDSGKVKYQLGVRPSKMAEFIIVTITQWDGGQSIEE